MTTETPIKNDAKDLIDIDKLIKDIFGSKKSRNDLAVGVYNDCNAPLEIGYYVDHGDLTSASASGTIEVDGTWKAGVHAVGAGSNITLNVTMPNNSAWAIMVATPVNKENYVKIATSPHPFKDNKDAYHHASKEHKQFASSSVNETHNGYNAVVHMTGNSPAGCSIVFSDAANH
jgi:type 1 fimbria pilin